jgi:hypothetical protein
MNDIRLTQRGRTIRNIIVIIAVTLLVWRLNDLTTPEVCKVAVEDMSGACKRLLFP